MSSRRIASTILWRMVAAGTLELEGYVPYSRRRRARRERAPPVRSGE